jgi:protein pelota
MANPQGYVTLRPEDDEDMYHIYNLISPGDQVRALAVRRVQTTSSTGSSDSYRVRVQLQISVTKTSFSQAASGSALGAGGGGLASNGTSNDKRGEGTASLQISGQVVNENEYVRLGAFHTLDLEGEPYHFPYHRLLRYRGGACGRQGGRSDCDRRYEMPS